MHITTFPHLSMDVDKAPVPVLCPWDFSFFTISVRTPEARFSATSPPACGALAYWIKSMPLTLGQPWSWPGRMAQRGIFHLAQFRAGPISCPLDWGGRRRWQDVTYPPTLFSFVSLRRCLGLTWPVTKMSLMPFAVLPCWESCASETSVVVSSSGWRGYDLNGQILSPSLSTKLKNIKVQLTTKLNSIFSVNLFPQSVPRLQPLCQGQ